MCQTYDYSGVAPVEAVPAPGVNLFGGSYGASAAQVFQQMYPARVRTMTLLSGTGPATGGSGRHRCPC